MTAFADVVDRALELGIAPSFTRVGSDVRSRLDHWVPLTALDGRGRVVVITGATSGLGLAAAEALCGCGATVVIVARNAAKAEKVCATLRAAGAPGGVDFVTADISDLDSVRAVARHEIRARHATVDVLVHNAGALDREFARSPQGIEHTVAAQVAGPFLLTVLLRRELRAAAHGRVIWVSSGGMYSQPLSVDDLEMTPADYDGTKAYARAKRAQVTLAELWADELRDDGIVVHAMHPGWADTPGVRSSLPTFGRVVGPLLRSPAAGADTTVWLALDDGAPLATSGRFWHDRRPRPIHRLRSTRRSDTPEERQRLWAWCIERVRPEAGED